MKNGKDTTKKGSQTRTVTKKTLTTTGSTTATETNSASTKANADYLRDMRLRSYANFWAAYGCILGMITITIVTLLITILHALGDAILLSCEETEALEGWVKFGGALISCGVGALGGWLCVKFLHRSINKAWPLEKEKNEKKNRKD